MNIIRNWGFLVLLLFCLGTSFASLCEATEDKKVRQAVYKIFEGNLPENYRIMKGGVIPKEKGLQGDFLVLQNASSRMLAMIVITEKLGKSAEAHPLMSNDLGNVAIYLYKEYVGLIIDRENIELVQQPIGFCSLPYQVSRLYLKFVDAFDEPDIIFKLNYPNGRSVIALFGMPNFGVLKEAGDTKKVKSNFKKEYELMEAEAKRVLATSSLSKNLVPVNSNPLDEFLMMVGLGPKNSCSK